MDEIEAFLRAHPEASRKCVMRALGVSARAVRRAESAVAAQRSGWRSSSRRGLLLFGGTALGAGVLALGLGRGAAEPSTAAPTRSVAVVQGERDLYAALDTRSPALRNDARARLASDDESLRIAALRYLVGTDLEESGPALLRLFEDPSERVRRVALQLLGTGLPGEAADDALAVVLLDPARPLEERVLAMSALEDRRVASPLTLARKLVVLLDDRAPLLTSRAPGLLARLVGRAPTRSTREAWLQLVAEVS